MFCKSRLRGIKCPLEGLPGKKPYELSEECIELVRAAGRSSRPRTE
jgi:hypothetical protein